MLLKEIICEHSEQINAKICLNLKKTILGKDLKIIFNDVASKVFQTELVKDTVALVYNLYKRPVTLVVVDPLVEEKINNITYLLQKFDSVSLLTM